MDESEVRSLSDKRDRLIARCQKLETENTVLRQMRDEWQRERAQLLQKNDMARNKIEAMISRLRALEQR